MSGVIYQSTGQDHFCLPEGMHNNFCPYLRSFTFTSDSDELGQPAWFNLGGESVLAKEIRIVLRFRYTQLTGRLYVQVAVSKYSHDRNVQVVFSGTLGSSGQLQYVGITAAEGSHFTVALTNLATQTNQGFLEGVVPPVAMQQLFTIFYNKLYLRVQSATTTTTTTPTPTTTIIFLTDKNKLGTINFETKQTNVISTTDRELDSVFTLSTQQDDLFGTKDSTIYHVDIPSGKTSVHKVMTGLLPRDVIRVAAYDPTIRGLSQPSYFFDTSYIYMLGENIDSGQNSIYQVNPSTLEVVRIWEVCDSETNNPLTGAKGLLIFSNLAFTHNNKLVYTLLSKSPHQTRGTVRGQGASSFPLSSAILKLKTDTQEYCYGIYSIDDSGQIYRVQTQSSYLYHYKSQIINSLIPNPIPTIGSFVSLVEVKSSLITSPTTSTTTTPPFPSVPHDIPASTTTTTTPLQEEEPEEEVDFIPQTTQDKLNKTQTVLYTPAGNRIELVTYKRGAFNFGTIAPGETSDTLIVALETLIPIGNIRLALIGTGGITFRNDIFGYTSNPILNSTITPVNFFQGINTGQSSTSPYNIAIDNKDQYHSEFVYLNLNLPLNNFLKESVIRYQWFFDYAE